MDMLKTKQIRSIMQEVEHAVLSSASTSSEEDDRERATLRRRESAASQERWAESISSTSLRPSIWGSQLSSQQRGRASRSASFSVGQEIMQGPTTATKHGTQEIEGNIAYDETRLLREQFQQMKFKNRSKSSYAAAWHVPSFDEYDNTEDAILDEEDLITRFRQGDPPGLRYTTPSNPRLEHIRERDRRASFNTTPHFQVMQQGRRAAPSSHPLRQGSISFHTGLETNETNDNTAEATALQSQHYSSSLQANAMPNDSDRFGNLLANVDRYFSSDDHRTRTRTHLAQTAAAHSTLISQSTSTFSNGTVYVVEFKACRTDIFYVAEGARFQVRVGDLVIVEADRGRDLGKVIRENLTQAQMKAFKIQQARDQASAMGGASDDSEKLNMNNLEPKLIYRLSQPSEVAMLLMKSQDEQQAMLVCQAKVRQRKLPMEVLDGEYQWDRRKLTFYYYATQRIDFRELVRDLFKIYKTRIWMCASNPISVTNANLALGAPGAVGDPKANEKAHELQHYSFISPQNVHGFGYPAERSGEQTGYLTYGPPHQFPNHGQYQMLY